MISFRQRNPLKKRSVNLLIFKRPTGSALIIHQRENRRFRPDSRKSLQDALGSAILVQVVVGQSNLHKTELYGISGHPDTESVSVCLICRASRDQAKPDNSVG